MNINDKKTEKFEFVKPNKLTYYTESTENTTKTATTYINH